MYDFLDTWGFINTGLRDATDSVAESSLLSAHPMSPSRGDIMDEPATSASFGDSLKVVVVGAGVAGLMAARQLQRFGCEVRCLFHSNDVTTSPRVDIAPPFNVLFNRRLIVFVLSACCRCAYWKPENVSVADYSLTGGLGSRLICLRTASAA